MYLFFAILGLCFVFGFGLIIYYFVKGKFTRRMHVDASVESFFIVFFVYLFLFIALSYLLSLLDTKDFLQKSDILYIASQLVVTVISFLFACLAIKDQVRKLAKRLFFPDEKFIHSLRSGLFAYCAVLPVFILGWWITTCFFKEIKPEEHPFIPFIKEGGFAFAFAVIYAVVIAPFIEEIIFRGFLYTGLRVKYGFWPSCIISATIFSAIHPTMPFTFLPLFGLGLVLGILREMKGSVVPGIVCHAINNFVATIMVIFAYKYI